MLYKAKGLVCKLAGFFVMPLLLLACAPDYETPQVLAGKVRFFKHADSDFDAYSEHPDAKQQQWMQAHYDRMLTHTPYFDTRLTWFPKAWFYLDSYAIYVDSDVAKQHPEWILHDEKKQPLYIPWQCHGQCKQFAGDFSNPEFRNYKIAEIRNALAKGYQGVWLDDVNLAWRVSDNDETPIIPMDANTGTPMTLDNWRKYFAEFMETIRQAFPTAEIAHNVIWYADQTLENPWISRQIKAADYINLERGGNDAGLSAGKGAWGYETFLQYLDYVHQQQRGIILMDTGTTPNEREYGLATWLLSSNGDDFISSGHLDWSTPDRWWPGYDSNLGAALNKHYQWHGLLRRDFTCGQVLLNQPTLPTQTIILDEPWQRVDGTTVTKLELASKSAAILIKPCQPVTAQAQK